MVRASFSLYSRARDRNSGCFVFFTAPLRAACAFVFSVLKAERVSVRTDRNTAHDVLLVSLKLSSLAPAFWAMCSALGTAALSSALRSAWNVSVAALIRLAVSCHVFFCASARALKASHRHPLWRRHSPSRRQHLPRTRAILFRVPHSLPPKPSRYYRVLS